MYFRLNTDNLLTYVYYFIVLIVHFACSSVYRPMPLSEFRCNMAIYITLPICTQLRTLQWLQYGGPEVTFRLFIIQNVRRPKGETPKRRKVEKAKIRGAKRRNSKTRKDETQKPEKAKRRKSEKPRLRNFHTFRLHCSACIYHVFITVLLCNVWDFGTLIEKYNVCDVNL